MAKSSDKKPPNFWHVGDAYLHDLPEIAEAIKALVKKYPEFKTAMQKIGKLPWKKQAEGFEGLVSIIIGQQISLAAAAHIAERLRALMPEFTPENFLMLTEDKLREIGFSRQKVSYSRDIAKRIISGDFDPERLRDMDTDEALDELTSLKGIGMWSAEIYLMFCLGKPDVWPADDIGLLNGLQRFNGYKKRLDPERAREIGEKWAPYRTAAALIVWKA
ncbi:MAG: DNA-3-methyladenine glycosylase 2 family protein [bacterium]|nr:DNA-3-methyladenine glycosylase 2 family protein [bacterium]